MAKFEFQKDPSRRKHKSIDETVAAKPSKTFDLEKFAKDNNQNKEEKNISDSKIGRPRKNKVYSTIRIQKSNVNRINALQNTLDYDTQDDMISFLLERLENQLDPEERIMYNMYMKTYESRDKKKNSNL